MTQSTVAAASTVQGDGRSRIRLHVVFNNLPYRAGLQIDWGFSCLIECLEKTLLFDTGGDGDILLSNMRKLGLDAEAIEAVVLSHIHGDHTGGLDTFLAHNPDVTVYFPDPFRQRFTARSNGPARRLKPSRAHGSFWTGFIPPAR